MAQHFVSVTRQGFPRAVENMPAASTRLVHAYFGMYIGKAVTVRAFIMPVDCVGFISFHHFLKGVSVPLGNGLVAFHDFRQCLSPDLVEVMLSPMIRDIS